jgi:hypothetical protein
MKPYHILNNQSYLLNDVRGCYEYLTTLYEKCHPDLALKTAVLKIGTEERKPIQYMFDKYDFLMGYVLIWELGPGKSIRAHKDGPLSIEQGNPRLIGLNVPVSGCNESCVTSFYNVDPQDEYVDMAARSRFVKINSPRTKIDEYRLVDKPVLIDTQIFHDLDNTKNSEKRVAISWTTTFKTLEEAVKYFNEQE